MSAPAEETAVGTAEEHRAALSTARDYCNKLTTTVMAPQAYAYATEAREIAETYMNAEVPAARLRIARDLARNLVMAAFLADHLDSCDGGR